MASFRIAHISDLHFSKISFNPLQFCSKRWLGNLNLLFSRKKNFAQEGLFSLIPVLKQYRVDYVIITGDLSTTSLESEFSRAATFINELKKEKMRVFILPGNHDHYTKQAYRNKLFYKFFPSPLKEFGVSLEPLEKGWWLLMMDTALATQVISSQGYFSHALEEALTQRLLQIPKNEKIILANHFPLFEQDSPRKQLMRSAELKGLLQKFPNVLFYLHGHTHRHCIADLRANQLPIVLDSGSTSHREEGSWNLIEITPSGCQIEAFSVTSNAEWRQTKQLSLTWESR